MKAAPFLRWIASNEPFRKTSLTLCGMLLCIFASVLGLVSASSDQTGYSAAAITHEFRGAVGLSQQGEAIFSDRTPSAILKFASLRQEATRADARQRHRIEEEEDELFSLEDADSSRDSLPRDVDLNSGFHNFVREVDRLGNVGHFRFTESTATVDVFSSQTMSAVERTSQIASLILTVHEALDGNRSTAPMEYRVTLWSPTPSIAAIRTTTEQALTLEALLARRLDRPDPSNMTISVECTCWMLPDSPRPDYSLRAIRLQP